MGGTVSLVAYHYLQQQIKSAQSLDPTTSSNNNNVLRGSDGKIKRIDGMILAGPAIYKVGPPRLVSKIMTTFIGLAKWVLKKMMPSVVLDGWFDKKKISTEVSHTSK